MDLILSSGFLAFSRHVGAIEGLQHEGVALEALVGTSSGALVGALFQAGLAPEAIARLLSRNPPLYHMRLHTRPWQGLFSLHPLVPLLRQHLPDRFEDLPRPFAVGVRDESGTHRLLYRGNLIAAVMASIAIPYVFPPVLHGDQRYVDGGVADRTGVGAWRQWRPNRHAVVHVVARSRGRDVTFDAEGTIVVRSPRSGAKFWSLGDFEAQRQQARELVVEQLASEKLRAQDPTIVSNAV